MIKFKNLSKFYSGWTLSIAAVVFGAVVTRSWVPIYIFLGVLAFATCITIYLVTRKYKGDVNIVVVSPDESKYVSDDRFHKLKQQEEETVH